MTDLPHGYPYQSIAAPYGSPYPPYHVPAASAANTEVVPPHRSCSPAAAAPLPSAHLLHSRLLDADVKPQKLEPSKTSSFLKQEAGTERPLLDMTPDHRGPRRGLPEDHGDPKPQTQPLPLLVPGPPRLLSERPEEVGRKDEEVGQIKTEASSYSYPPPPPLTKVEPKPEVIRDPGQFSPCAAAAISDRRSSSQTCPPLERIPGAACEREQPDARIHSLAPGPKEHVNEAPAYPPPPSVSPLPLVIGPEDPMAGMFALLAASEMAQARPDTLPTLTLIGHASSGADRSSTGALEMVALDGMALLSQMAQREMEHIRLEQGEQRGGQGKEMYKRG